ncbi:unnamed protein product [Schistosoma curassoni]|uniref:CCHC-type domain-containing protein n=1 Tax=Schistosoma curassoni TaxID=6186 RepID=A0A183K2U3_9TREM|nr:unnamed protein product [Schistosoma curassoni]
MIGKDIKNSTTLCHHNPVHTQSYADNSLKSCGAVHEDGCKFGHCLSCGKSHAFNPYKFRNSKCFKCGDIGQVQSVCNTNVHLAATNIKSCNSDSIKLSIYNNHLSLSTIAIDSVESYSSSELSETQNSCETAFPNQSTYHISHIIVLDMVFPNDLLISDEFLTNLKKPGEVLIDDDFSNDPLICNDILNKFEETISEESNLDILSNIICPHTGFVSRGKLVQ